MDKNVNDSINALDKLLNKQKGIRGHKRAKSSQSLLQKNLAYFKDNIPEFYHDYKNYQPRRFVIEEKNKKPQLIDKDKNISVYGAPAKPYSKQVVSQYLTQPSRLTFVYDFKHQTFKESQYIEKCIAKYADEFDRFQGDIQQPIGLMVISGIGLGYHLELLTEQLDIAHCCLFEPYKDNFFASMHTIDWQEIIEKFNQHGRSLHFFIDKSAHSTLLDIRYILNHYGQHNACNAFYFEIFQDEKYDEFYQAMYEKYHYALSGYGFFEDELISLQHTVGHFNQGLPILVEHDSRKIALPPVVIVGNGPSLDMLHQSLKKLSQKVYIASCGTALETLYKMGIKADFHIEMERTYETVELHLEEKDNDYKKEVSLLCLNIVSPELAKLFKDTYVAMKVNDAGIDIAKLIMQQGFSELKYCNPTCTNTGLAFMLALGFKHIFLAGIDFGMQDTEHHHAQFSRYYDKSTKILNISTVSGKTFALPGNFRESVLTTHTLNRSKILFEENLSLHKDVEVFNLSDGAYIKGTQALEQDKLNAIPCLDKQWDKNTIKSALLSQCFSQAANGAALDENMVRDHAVKQAIQFIDDLNLPKTCPSINELKSHCDAIQKALQTLRKTSHSSYCLLNGSVMNFLKLIILSGYAFHQGSKETFMYQDIVSEFLAFMAYCKELLSQDFLKYQTIN